MKARMVISLASIYSQSCLALSLVASSCSWCLIAARSAVANLSWYKYLSSRICSVASCMAVVAPVCKVMHLFLKVEDIAWAPPPVLRPPSVKILIFSFWLLRPGAMGWQFSALSRLSSWTACRLQRPGPATWWDQRPIHRGYPAHAMLLL